MVPNLNSINFGVSSNRFFDCQLALYCIPVLGEILAVRTHKTCIEALQAAHPDSITRAHTRYYMAHMLKNLFSFSLIMGASSIFPILEIYLVIRAITLLYLVTMQDQKLKFPTLYGEVGKFFTNCLFNRPINNPIQVTPASGAPSA